MRIAQARPVERSRDDDRAEAIEREIDELLAEANGDARAAMRALLHDFEALLKDALTATSRGYVRGRFVRLVWKGVCRLIILRYKLLNPLPSGLGINATQSK